ncbi:MAG: GNAT family protein [Pseudomonadota bacterium]
MTPPGTPVPDWRVPSRAFVPLAGAHAVLEPLSPAHCDALCDAFAGADTVWTYLASGPFADGAALWDWAAGTAADGDTFFYAIRDAASGRALGYASYLRINPAAGSIEVGNITLSPALQRSRAATEAMVLMMGWAFAAGYRRYEWKCNALNLPSRRAAQRLGFAFEGVHRQALVTRGHNRDTAWFSVIDGEWPALKAAFEEWLAPGNFDAHGRQKTALSSRTTPLLAARDPALRRTDCT